MKSGSLQYNKQRGFILLSVMISVTLLLTSAMAFAWFARTEAKKAETESLILKARSAAEIACTIAAEKIAKDKNGYDSRTEILYSPNIPTRIALGDYTVAFNIEPLDNKIPLKGLFLPDGVTVRTEYEDAWNSIWNTIKQPDLAVLVLDFMDSDSKQKLGGSERADNINRLVSDLTELKLIPEVTDDILYGKKEAPLSLNTYLTVYGREKININVASPSVLAILDIRIGESVAQNIAAARLTAPLKSVDDLKKVPGFPAAVATKRANIWGFESSYFRVLMKVSDKSKRERNYSIILQRSGASCKIVRWEE